MTDDFLTYINGRLMPHSQALPELQRVNTRAAGGYYDSARTFGGSPFRLRQHLERLFSGLTYSNIDPGITVDDLERTSLGLIEANTSLMDEGLADMVVTQTVTVARPRSADDLPSVDVAIYCTAPGLCELRQKLRGWSSALHPDLISATSGSDRRRQERKRPDAAADGQ